MVCDRAPEAPCCRQDGHGDLEWCSDDVSPGSLRINDGSGNFTELDFSPGGWNRVRGVWDYDGDGILDLVDETGAIYDGNLVLDGSIGEKTAPSSTSGSCASG